MPYFTLVRTASALTVLAFCAQASAMQVVVTATVTNLAPANSISYAPLRVGFNAGVYDAFNLGQVAGPAIISVAEGGSGAAWFPAFAAADPTATLGTVGGLLTPGASASSSFVVDAAINRFFTYAAMVVPSNDLFVGNDSPTQFQILNNAGDLLVNSITVTANRIWDAGSEVFDPAAAAFVGNNSLRAPQNSVVAFNFAETYGFNGLTTGAGYVFNSQLAANTPVYRIDFGVSPVPEPGSWALMAGGLLAMGFMLRRRRDLGVM